MSRSKNRIREKFFSNFTFYAYFIKGNFKALPEKLFSAEMTKFFRRILKIFLISKTISTWVLEVFLDDAKQVFILNFSIWRPESENREKIPIILIPGTPFAYEFNELIQKGPNENRYGLAFWAIFAFRVSNRSEISTVVSASIYLIMKLVSDFLLDF